jgi:hypothetical protein
MATTIRGLIGFVSAKEQEARAQEKQLRQMATDWRRAWIACGKWEKREEDNNGEN